MAAERTKFRLNILGSDEDVPRLLLAYGRGCGGEVALVLRPREAKGVLVHQLKGVPAKVWASDLGWLPEGVGHVGETLGDRCHVLGADAFEAMGWSAADALRGAMGVFCAVSAACWLHFALAGRR